MFAVTVSLPQPSRAQPATEPARGAAQPAATARVTRPRPIGSLDAPYPKGASGDAQVLLELVVGVDGTVQEARVVGGREPFATAALAAARAWRFQPARREGRPVPVKVRAVAEFREPLREAVATTPARPPAQAATAVEEPASDASAADDVEPIEVTVRGDQVEAGGKTISRAEVRLLPGAFGDPLRAVGAFPGVTPLASGVPFFYVRGAPPGNVGYFLDGVRVPLLYHIGLGPSVVNPALIDRVDFFPGAYPVRFGRFAGGIVSAEAKPPADEVRAEAALRAIDAGGLVESPFAQGRGTALVGGRYSYVGPLLRLFAPDTELVYRDYQLRAGYDLTRRDTVSVFAFGSYDYLGEREDGDTRIVFSTEFHRLDLRYDTDLGGDGKLRHAITLGFDRTRFDQGHQVNARSLASRSEFEYRVDGATTLRAGADSVFDAYRARLAGFAEGVNFPSLFPPRDDVTSGAYCDLVFRFPDGTELTPGLRTDLFVSQGAVAASADPRFVGRYPVSRTVRLINAIGLAHQAPGFVATGPGFQIGGLRGGLQHSFQLSSGMQWSLPEDVTATITLFRNAFFNLSDPLGTQAADLGGPSKLEERSLGSSTGAELELRRRLTRKLGGFVSYTLSRSERASGRSAYLSQYDRTHVLNAVLGYDLGRGWRAGARGIYYSGIPRYVPGRPLVASSRLPDFWRLDWRLEKRWRIGKQGFLAAVAEMQNTTLNREVLAVSCEPEAPIPGGPAQVCEDEAIGPVTIPSIGIEGAI